MVPHNHRYVAEMFFRREGRIFAGLSVLREESLGDFSPEELELLRKVQPFVEYSLNAIYLPQRDQERHGIAEKYELTERKLADEDLARMELFLTARGCTYLGWIRSRQDTDTARDMARDLIRRACEQAERFLSRG